MIYMWVSIIQFIHIYIIILKVSTREVSCTWKGKYMATYNYLDHSFQKHDQEVQDENFEATIFKRKSWIEKIKKQAPVYYYLFHS